jgi:hypothetical protein
MLRLVQGELAAIGQPEAGDQPPPRIADVGRELDPFAFQLVRPREGSFSPKNLSPLHNQPKGGAHMPLINVILIEDALTPDQGNETVVEDGPVRARITANSNETIVEDA